MARHFRLGATATYYFVSNGDAPDLPSESSDDPEEGSYGRFGMGGLMGVQSRRGGLILDVLAGGVGGAEKCSAWTYPEGECTAHRSVERDFYLAGRLTMGMRSMGLGLLSLLSYALEIGNYGATGRVVTLSAALAI